MELNNLEKWTKVGDWDGHYRYAIGAKCAYEIFIECWYVDTQIETAKASLCITGLWDNGDNASSLEREWLGEHLPIHELLEIAEKDYKENVK